MQIIRVSFCGPVFPGSVWAEFPVTLVRLRLLKGLTGWLPVLQMVTANENGVHLVNQYDQPGTGRAVI